MNLSYREKSTWGWLAAMVLVFGYYFATVFGAARGPVHGGALARLVGAVIVLIVIEVGAQIVIAIEAKVEPRDERDVLIASKAYRNAYFALAVGAFLLMTCVILFDLTPFVTVNLIMLFMVLSEVFKSATQLFYYRRGV